MKQTDTFIGGTGFIVSNRNLSIELLRVISMFTIVMLHALVKTNVFGEIPQGSVTYFIARAIYGLCMTGNNVMVLISAYFLVDSKFNVKRVLSLYFPVLFYSIAFRLIIQYILGSEVSSSWRNVLLPVTSREYWFFTVYIGMYFLFPYFNILISRMKQYEYLRLLILLSVFFSVIPTFLGTEGWLGDNGSFSIVWFAYLYFISGYLKRFGMIKGHQKKWRYIYLCSIMIIPLYEFAMIFLEQVGLGNLLVMEGHFINMSQQLYQSNVLPALVASVSLFMLFLGRNSRFKNSFLNSSIACFGKLTFGIYLIHNNRNIAHYFWEKININYWLAEREDILMSILLTLLVFVACALIDFLRIKLWNLFGYETALTKLAEFINNIFEKVFRFFTKLNKQ